MPTEEEKKPMFEVETAKRKIRELEHVIDGIAFTAPELHNLRQQQIARCLNDIARACGLTKNGEAP